MTHSQQNENDPEANLNVLSNESDFPDSHETLTITSVTGFSCTDGRDSSVGTTSGTISVTPSGSAVTFSTVEYFWGTCSFDYSVSDGNGGTSTAHASITINNGEC